MLSLPYELLINIYSKLNLNDIKSLSIVCKKFYWKNWNKRFQQMLWIPRIEENLYDCFPTIRKYSLHIGLNRCIKLKLLQGGGTDVGNDHQIRHDILTITKEAKSFLRTSAFKLLNIPNTNWYKFIIVHIQLTPNIKNIIFDKARFFEPSVYVSEYTEDKPITHYYINTKSYLQGFHGSFKYSKLQYGKHYGYLGNLLYFGDYRNDQRHGNGIQYYNGKPSYKGQWINGYKTGKGMSFFQDGQIEYDGLWFKGTWHGDCVIYHKNGNKRFEGICRNDYFHIGTSYYKNGNKLVEGRWNQGYKEGECKYYLKNGNLRFEGIYEILFQNGEKGSYYKEGIYYYKNGNIQYCGCWKDGIRNIGVWFSIDGKFIFSGNKYDLMTKIADCVSNNKCTYTLTKKTYVDQKWMNCLDCFPNDLNKGVCMTCAKTCHKNHDLKERETRSTFSFFCDCGSGDCNFECQCL